MTISLFSISDDRKKINKNLDDKAALCTVSANLKTPCSIMRPVVQITKGAPGTNWYQCNYAYISAFGRYYFVDNITAENDGIITLELTVDVLYTYAAQLMGTQFQIIRAERYYGAYFVDTQIPLLANKNIRQDKDTDFLGSIPQDTGDTKYNYVMTVAGG